MPDSSPLSSTDRLAAMQAQAAENARLALDHMAQYGIRPEGEVRPFLPPETRRHTIDRMPYNHKTRQVVTYTTAPGEFTALCPFSGLPDFGTVRVEYVPGSWVLELKSLKYYLMSWREVGAAQEDITAILFEDLHRHLDDAEYLVVTTDYNVRGGIHTVCTVDSRAQAPSPSPPSTSTAEVSDGCTAPSSYSDA